MSARAELIRNEVLFQCYGYRPASRDAAHLAAAARRSGEVADALPAEIEREAAYLVGRGLLEEKRDELAQAVKRWAITAAGIDFVEANGLA